MLYCLKELRSYDSASFKMKRMKEDKIASADVLNKINYEVKNISK